MASAAPTPSPTLLPTTADFLEDISKLVQKHQEDLSRCFETWIQNSQVPRSTDACDWRQPWDRRGVAAAAAPASSARPASTVASQDVRPSTVLCWDPPLLSGTSERSTSVSHPKDSLASQVAGKKRKRRKSIKRVSDLVRSANAALERPSWLQRLTTSRAYDIGSGMLILLNAVFIGWQIQFLAERAEKDASAGQALQQGSPVGFVVWEAIFLLLFSVELGLRWVCAGFFEFFRDRDIWWNVLDIAVVGFSFVDTLIDISFHSDSDFVGNVSVLRVIRVVRVIRVAKVIRIMKFFRELRMMIFSILGSMKSLLWVVLVLVMTFYVFGITFTSGVTTALDTTERWLSEDTEALRLYFATLDRSMLSLFMAMSGGNDWGIYYDALRELPAQYCFLFVLFISFSLFAVVNIVTGVFVQSAMESNNKDRDIMVHEELESKKAYLRSMREVFDHMDEDETGLISMEEFENKLDDDRIKAYFNALKLDVSDARTLFRLLDYDRSDEVDIDEFLTGCYRLQGESRSLDMKIMQCEVRYMQEHFATLLDRTREIQKALPFVK